jgi:hypothetical protein
MQVVDRLSRRPLPRMRPLDIDGNALHTVFLTPSDQFQFVSSSFVREIALLGGEVDQFVSPLVQLRLREKYVPKGPVKKSL